ncbi:hypothetical protein PGH07_00080 [Sulfurovum sp. zt1-1]|uniref:Uncharacterized protein n=1 Tax=Sulfurovum zhangzhouensis TaxID=3019067 RepID=A0ABT7QUQ9_9BACT|nr:hypothetical protein [Sulfurovum zhangzhouensis]MDM5270573.1 hypothetical protein [Sulfurovum zhangzhouensis]
MSDLKIRIYKHHSSDPATTVTIPGSVLKTASKLIPQHAMNALHEKGIDLDEIIKLSDNPDAKGTIIEMEEHDKDENIIMELE